MKHILNFNAHTHDLWPIYNAIVKFYPIGLRRDEQSIFFEYPGIKDLGKIVVDVIHKEDEFYQSWLAFERDIASTFNRECQGTTMGQQPALSADLILEKTETENFINIKKLKINLSLVGKFYTIYGIDESASLERQDCQIIRSYYATNTVTVSPYKEFEQPFKEVQSLLEARFRDYKFVPFGIHSMIITGLRVRYSDKEVCTVYDALFNGHLDYLGEMTYKRGNLSYGYEEYWRIPNTGDQDFMVSIAPPPAI
jgi:hypothetical protein